MLAKVDTLAEEALRLPETERAALAYRILSSIETDPEPEADAAWVAEISRRISEYEAGRSQPVAAKEVFAGLRKIAPDE